MTVVETPRLILRRLTLDDAEFIHQLLNEPSFLEFIGDKGVRTLDDARDYLLKGPIASYATFGFGLNLVNLKQDGTHIGMCGLLKREALPDVDVGFAFLPAYWSTGYAVGIGSRGDRARQTGIRPAPHRRNRQAGEFCFDQSARKARHEIRRASEGDAGWS